MGLAMPGMVTVCRLTSALDNEWRLMGWAGSGLVWQQSFVAEMGAAGQQAEQWAAVMLGG